jgi:diguanylate cyclase (GGDEF)-like protein
MAQLQDVTDRKRFEVEMEHRALHDELTGLPNRALLDDRLERALHGGEPPDDPMGVGVAFVDLDDFKHVNDALGHSVGDLLLIEVARRLVTTIRPADTVARFGGDEFVVVCQEISPDALFGLADRIIDAIRAPFVVNDRNVSLRASLGLTISRPESTAQSLISEADAAMYRAKERGRGRSAMFDDSLRQHATTRLEGEQQLRAALSHREILAYYQPIVDLTSGAIVGVEALARWLSADGRLATPYQFIPLAEACGLIGELDEQILDQGIDTIAAWNGEPLITTPQWVSVNLSALQLADRHLVDLVSEALLRSRIHPSQLHFEITESVVMRDVGQSIATLEDLKALGVNLSIDDFGTGYSSLAYLQQLPLHTLKIDRSFVNRLDQPTSDGSISIVAAILSLADALHLTCVAEGVETAAQRDVLVDLGCTYAQGYLWSEPLPRAEALTWALSHQTLDQT